MSVSGCLLRPFEAKVALLVLAASNKSKVLRREIRTVDNRPREELIFLCRLFVFALPAHIDEAQQQRGVSLLALGLLSHLLITAWSNIDTVCHSVRQRPAGVRASDPSVCHHSSRGSSCWQRAALLSIYLGLNELAVIVPALLNNADRTKDDG